MKKIIPLLLLSALAYAASTPSPSPSPSHAPSPSPTPSHSPSPSPTPSHSASPSPSPSPSPIVSATPLIAIANWDMVPYQTFVGDFNVGVVAFHQLGIDRVDFSVNGGAPIGVSQMTLNPTTGVIEYWMTLSATNFPDGVITVSATAYPTAGLSKGMAPLTLYANSKGSLTVPSMTVSTVSDLQTALAKVADGGTIYMAPGTYALPSTGGANRANTRWITLTPTSPAGKVLITSAPGAGRIIMHVGMLHFQNVTLDTGGGYLNGVTADWLDHATLTQTGWGPPAPAHDPGQPLRTALVPTGGYNIFVTDSEAINTIYGFVNCQLVRNAIIHNIDGDALQNSKTVLNSQVYDFAGTLVHHADVYQMWGALDNVILYGVQTYNTSGAQGLFLQPTIPGSSSPSAMTNSAFVNVTLMPNDADGKGGPPFSQMQSKFSNMLFQNWQTPNQMMSFRTDGTGVSTFNASSVLFKNCVFHPQQQVSGVPGITFQGCTIGTSSKANWPGL